MQNPTLYQQYRAKKRDMKMNNSSNTANEQQLWHGTNAANISSIITNGFNRGYCGQNGEQHFNLYLGDCSCSIFYANIQLISSAQGNKKRRVQQVNNTLTGIPKTLTTILKFLDARIQSTKLFLIKAYVLYVDVYRMQHCLCMMKCVFMNF